MKKTLLAMTSFLLALFIALPVMAAKDVPGRDAKAGQPLKIGIVNMQKILQESKAAQTARAGFMKELEDKKAQLAAKAQEVQKLEQEMARLDQSVSVETRRLKADKLKHESRELGNLRQDVEEEIKRKDRDTAQKIFGEIMQIIRNYARNERLSLILERSTIVTAEEGLDITDKILKLYDSQKK